MPKTSEMFPSAWFKATDFTKQGRVLTISELRYEQVGPDKKMQWVLYFQETEKKLILKPTNCTSLEYCFGNDSDDWIGQQVHFFQDSTRYQGKIVPAIRVKEEETMAILRQVRLNSRSDGQTPPSNQQRPNRVSPAPMTQQEANEVADDDIPF